MKNKITLAFVIISILEILQLILDFKLLGATYTRVVEFLIFAFALILNRVETLNKIEEEKRAYSKLKIVVSWSVLKMFKYLFEGVTSDFRKLNLTAKENIPSHIFIGISCQFLVFGFIQTTFFAWFTSLFLSILVGFTIEAVQKYLFDGVPNDRDVRWGVYGVPIGFCIWYLLHLIIPNWDWYLPLIFILIFVATAFLMHKSFKKW